MHVAFFAPAWPLLVYPNGVVTYVHWMRRELLRRGHQVSVFTGALETPEAGIHGVAPAAPARMQTWLRSKLAPAEFGVFRWGDTLATAIARVHRVAPIDVMEMEESFGWFATVARRLPIPVVVKLHGPAFLSLVEEELDSDLAKTKMAAEGLALRQLPFIVSPARQILDATTAHYGLDPAAGRHIVNPLTLPLSAPIWNLRDCDAKSVLFVGRFDKRKGGDIVLRAFARLLEANPSLTLTFVGPDQGIPASDGGIEKIQTYRDRLFPGPTGARVVFRGKLGADEICSLRARAVMTVVASRWENQSYTLLEAMLQGCPVISSDAGGHRELIESGVTGLLAAAGDAADLCVQMQKLIDDPVFAAGLGSRARAFVLEHHSPEAVVSQTLEVYDAAIAHAHGAAAARQRR